MIPSSLIVSGLLFLTIQGQTPSRSGSQVGSSVLQGESKQVLVKPSATIALKRSVQVPGTKVLLGDIASITSKDADYARYLASIKVGAAPKSRWARWISRSAVQSSLRLQKVDSTRLTFTGKERVEVTALLDQIPAQEFLKQAEIALKALLQDQGEEDAEWNLSGRLRPVVIPRPREGYTLLASPAGNQVRQNYARFLVDINVDGEVIQRIQVAFQLSRFRRVLVCRLPLSAAEGYTSTNTEIRRVDVARLSLPADMSPLTQLSQTRGRVAARPIRPGAVLFETDLARPTVIKKGEIVTVIALVGKIRITTEGQAQRNGGVGDRIPVLVRRKRTNITVQAKVLGSGVVSVTVQQGIARR